MENIEVISCNLLFSPLPANHNFAYTCTHCLCLDKYTYFKKFITFCICLLEDFNLLSISSLFCTINNTPTHLLDFSHLHTNIIISYKQISQISLLNHFSWYLFICYLPPFTVLLPTIISL